MPRYVVVGPPDSGKKTWLREHAQPGDLVWDLDVVLPALTVGVNSARHQPMSDPLLYLADTLLQAFIDFVAARSFSRPSVFIVTTSAGEADWIAREIRAEIIRCPL